MGFIARLVFFAVALTAVLGVYRVVGRDREHGPAARVELHERVMVQGAEAPMDPLPPEPAIAVVEAPLPDLPPLGKGEVRILTTNRAAFMALRNDQIVAGLSDSLRAHIQSEMRRELRKENPTGVAASIGNAVVGGVSKLIEKEIRIPVHEIRDISYDRNRIVIVYRDGKPSSVMNLETIKSEGDRTLLEQFSEKDARRFVEAVKVRIK
jgi:hypothetical protein